MKRVEKRTIQILLIVINLFLAPIAFAKADIPVLVLDAANHAKIPKQFRTTAQFNSIPSTVSTKGLANLNAIGSSQFSQQELETVLQTVKQKPTIVDLRQESHGLASGNAISWYAKNDWANLGKTPEQVESDQQARLNAIKSKNIIITEKVMAKGEDGNLELQAKSIPVKQVESEQELAKEHHLNYLRIYVTDGMSPDNEQVDRFVQFERNLPANTWLYLHCRAGKGRTTSFMAMHDMMHNAKQVTFNDILKRQQMLGGINLEKFPSPNSYKYKLAKERVAFLKDFYQYCVANKDNFKTTWSQWKASITNSKSTNK